METDFYMVLYSNASIQNYKARSANDQFIWLSERISLREKWLVWKFCAELEEI